MKWEGNCGGRECGDLHLSTFGRGKRSGILYQPNLSCTLDIFNVKTRFYSWVVEREGVDDIVRVGGVKPFYTDCGVN